MLEASYTVNIVTTHSKKVLILFSSPNKNGHTQQLLQHTLKIFPKDAQFETIHVFETCYVFSKLVYSSKWY